MEELLMDCITIIMDFPRITGEEKIEIIKKIGKYGFGFWGTNTN